jgi:hypothetical protein
MHFLMKKSEVFDRFKEFKALVENQIGKRIKVLRTDNSGEFYEDEFEDSQSCIVKPHPPSQIASVVSPPKNFSTSFFIFIL